MYGIPRGILNHNPMNLRISEIPWANKITPSLDHDFEQFKSAFDGIRAGALNVSNYQRLHRLSTVQAIISRYAPSTENDTDAYISAVCKYLAISPEDPIDFSSADVLGGLVAAIILHENGLQPYSSAEIAAPIASVLGQTSISALA